jgi:hypothetical protein
VTNFGYAGTILKIDLSTENIFATLKFVYPEDLEKMSMPLVLRINK